jgi:hypothetical protein
VKNLYFILIIFLLPLSIRSEEKLKKDSLFSPIRIIYIDNSFRADTFSIDTGISKLHMLNPYMSNDISYTYLTRSAYPFQSNYLKTRLSLNDYFFPTNSFSTFIQDENTSYFYDTKRPFSSLTYKIAGSINDKEEFLEVIHTRGLSKTSNLGLHYNLFSNNSKNDNQRANDHSLNMFFRNSGKVYLCYYQLYYNSFTYNETGGLDSDSMVVYGSDYFVGLPKELKNANSKFLRFGINTFHEIKLGELFQNEDDSVESKTKDLGSLVYKFSIETNKKSYFEDNPNDSFYYHYYSKYKLLNDSIVLDKMTNKLLLNSPQLSKYLPNLRLSATNIMYNSFHGRVTDTVFFKDSVNRQWDTYSQNFITADFTQKLNKFIFNISGDSYLLGYGIGDYSLKASTTLYADSAKTMFLTLKAISELKKPSFLLNNIYSNHFIWNKGDSLLRIKKQELSGLLSIEKINTSISASYFLYSNMVYFTSDTLSKGKKIMHILNLRQADENLHIISFTLKNKINLWKFSTENIVTYQEFNENYFHLPKIIYYNSTEFQHTFRFSTGGKLYSKLGVDFRYQTRYKPDTYVPSLGVFALTDENEKDIYWTGDYPLIDIHLTFKVKNVSFFIKYAHLNAGYTGTHSFSAAHYPILPATLSYGINWLFYD